MKPTPQTSDGQVLPPELRQEETEKAIAAILEIPQRTEKVTAAELLSALDEGRKR